jgi:hypothetical protein
MVGEDVARIRVFAGCHVDGEDFRLLGVVHGKIVRLEPGREAAGRGVG